MTPSTSQPGSQEPSTCTSSKFSVTGDEPKFVWSAMPTPFLSSGALDKESLAKIVSQHERSGIGGLFVAGTCGEGALMPDPQRVELVREVKRLAGSRLHIAAQVSDTSAARVCENVRRMQDAGADSVVIAPPWIPRFSTGTALSRYFLEPFEMAEVPVGLYVLKRPDDSPLNLAFWSKMALHPKVSFVKDSSADATYRDALLDVKRQRPGLAVLTGNEFDVLSATGPGYDGVLLGTAILNGGLIRRALDAQAAGDTVAADAWQLRSNELLWDLFGRDISLWMGGLKYALVKLGLFSSAFMHMGYVLNDADRARIDEALVREQEYILPDGL